MTTAPIYSTEQLVELLDLSGHVEGGYYRRTYQADRREMIDTPDGERFSMSSIFYLLSAESPIGHFHLNKSDIVHYFHLGDPLTYSLIYPDGHLQTAVMGNQLHDGQLLQMTVPGGVWKASKINPGGSQGYSLISEAVSPGFDYADMTLGFQSRMQELFPQHRDLMSELSHPDSHRDDINKP